jgi:trehalose 6-phosphate phosphatase
MAEIARRARTELPPGAVEDKGLTVALHYRRHPELAGQLLAWGQEQTARHGLRLQHGRMVYELKPPGERNKGTVLREEAGGLKGVVYFGDDLGDIAAFEAMTELERARSDFRGVRVVVANDETGAEVAAHADVRVQRPEGVPGLLALLLTMTHR